METPEGETEEAEEAPKAEISEEEKLKEELKKAVQEQRFEDAAIIRDKINALHGEE